MRCASRRTSRAAGGTAATTPPPTTTGLRRRPWSRRPVNSGSWRTRASSSSRRGGSSGTPPRGRRSASGRRIWPTGRRTFASAPNSWRKTPTPRPGSSWTKPAVTRTGPGRTWNATGRAKPRVPSARRPRPWNELRSPQWAGRKSPRTRRPERDSPRKAGAQGRVRWIRRRLRTGSWPRSSRIAGAARGRSRWAGCP